MEGIKQKQPTTNQVYVVKGTIYHLGILPGEGQVELQAST